MTTTAVFEEAQAKFRKSLKEDRQRRFAKRDDSRHPLDVLEEHGLWDIWDFMTVCNLGYVHAMQTIRKLHLLKMVEATPYPGRYRVAPSQGCALPPVNTCTALVPWHSAPPQFAANYLRRFVVEQYAAAEFAPRPMQLEPAPF